MDFNNRWLTLAVKEASKSTYITRMGAVVYNKNSFISSGRNYPNRTVKSHLPKFRKYPTSIHAEVSAILNAKKDLKGTSILIVRLSNKGKLLLARPCEHCMAYLQYVGIKKVTYSTSEWPYLKEERL